MISYVNFILCNFEKKNKSMIFIVHLFPIIKCSTYKLTKNIDIVIYFHLKQFKIVEKFGIK